MCPFYSTNKYTRQILTWNKSKSVALIYGDVICTCGMVSNYIIYNSLITLNQFSQCSHVAEILVNIPNELAGQFLLPSNSVVTKTLCSLYPKLYSPKVVETNEIIEGGVVSGLGAVYTLNLDHVFDGFNMAPVVSLLNYLHLTIVSNTDRHFYTSCYIK